MMERWSIAACLKMHYPYSYSPREALYLELVSEGAEHIRGAEIVLCGCTTHDVMVTAVLVGTLPIKRYLSF